LRAGSVEIIGGQSLSARIGSEPHEQADPLQVVILARLSESRVRLYLQRLGQVRTLPFAVEEDPEDPLDALLEGASERGVRDRICPVLKEELRDTAVPSLDNILERYRIDSRTMSDRKLHNAVLIPPARLLEDVVLRLLVAFVLKQELDKAVESDLDGYAQRGLAIVGRYGQPPAVGDPSLQVKQPSVTTQAQKFLGILILWWFRAGRAGFRSSPDSGI